MRLQLNQTIAASLAVLSAAPAVAATAEKPNVLIIMTDQQSLTAINALKKYTTDCYCETPSVDRIVNDGVSFIQSYCPNPVSAPSRFAMFSGRYGSQYGFRSNSDWSKMNPDVVRPMLSKNAMGFIFKNAGYQTLYGGKVHLPMSGPKDNKTDNAPTSYGFDDYFSEDRRRPMADKLAKFIKTAKPTDKPFLAVASFINPHDICAEVSFKEEGHLKPDTMAWQKKSVEINNIIRAIHKKISTYTTEEFLGSVAPPLPANLECMEGSELGRQKWEDEYWRQYRYTYKELVKLVDGHIGVVLDALDANPQIKKNTIVVFTSDHGDMQGSHRATTKQRPFNECQQVPLIFAGAGIPKGKVNTTVAVSGVDIIPTICELAGVAATGDYVGESLAKVITGKSKSIDREYLFGEASSFLSVVHGDYKYTYLDRYKGKSKDILVNLKADPRETTNLLYAEPERYEKLAGELKSKIEAWQSSTK